MYFGKNTQIPNIMIIYPVGAKFSHVNRWSDRWKETDRWTKMMKVLVAFHSFVNVPSKQVKDHSVQV
jgi:hypothetical protein